jgi:hypothetical protein
MNENVRRRPVGATILAVVLGWLGVGAILNAIVWPALVRGKVSSLSVPEEFGSALFVVITLAYGISALCAARAVWRLAVSAPNWYLAWLVTLVATFIFLSVVAPGGFDAGAAIVALPVALLALAVWLYVRRLVTR